MKVVDISSFQGKPDFAKLKPCVDGVIIRIGGRGYGNAHKIYADEQFERNYAECEKFGIPVGAYFYSGAVTPTEALEEARYVISRIENKRFQLPIWWDSEDNHDIKKYFPESQLSIGKKRLTEVAKTFLNELQNAYIYTGIYASKSWLTDCLDMSQLTAYDVWVAQYYKECTYKGSYGMWQYSSTGTVNGINGNVDMNICYKDYPHTIMSAGLNGYPIPGDVDGDRRVTAEDARKTLRASVGAETLTELQKIAADMDGDGQITSEDARLVLRRSINIKE